MLKIFRWAGIIFIAIILMIAIAVTLFTERLIEFGASRALGRDMEITGSLDIDYSMVPTIHAEEIRIGNPDWSKHPNVLEAGALTASIDLRALFDGRLVLPAVSLTEPEMFLEKSVNGAVNWSVGNTTKEEKSAASRQATASEKNPSIPIINDLNIKNGKIVYIDHAENTELVTTIDALNGQLPLEKPVQLSANGQFEGQSYRLEVSAGPLKRLQVDVAPYPVKLDVITEAMQAHAEGTITAPMELDGVDVTMRLEGKALAALIPGEDVPALQEPFSIESRLSGNGDVWALSNIEGNLGVSSLRGDVLLDMSKKTPFIQANIKSRQLDVGFLKNLINGNPDKPDATPQRLPSMDMLKTVNALVHLESSEVIGTELPLDSFVLDLALENGVLVIDPFRLSVADGKLVAEIRLDASVPKPIGKIAMRFDDVPVLPLLDSFVETVDIDGIVDGQFTLGFSSDSIGNADGSVHYLAPKKGTSLTLKFDRVRNEQEWLLQVSADGTFRGALAQGSFTGQPFHLLTDLNAVMPVDLKLTLADTSAVLKGTVAELGKVLDVNASMSGPGTDRLSRITGIDLPELPNYKATGHVTRDHDTVKVEKLHARIGKSDLAGSAVVRNMHDEGKPSIGLDLASETLAYTDFDQLFGKGGESTDWLGQLDDLDANVEVAVERVIAPKQVVFRDIRLDGVLNDGLFKLKSMHFQVAGGKVAVTAEVRVDEMKGTDKKKSLRGIIKADVDNVHLAEALKPLGLGENMRGWLNADIDIALGPEAGKRTGKSTIQYNDGQGTDLAFTLSQTPSSTVLKGNGTFLREPFRLSGTADPLSHLVSEHRYAFDIDFKMLETSGEMAGSLREPLAFDGLKSSLKISGPNPRRAEPVVGFRLPELPPYRLKGNLLRQKDIWRFTDIKGTVGDSDLSGKIIVDNKKGKPYINADLHSNMLDFDDLSGIVGGTPGTEPGEVASPAQKKKAVALAKGSTVLPDQDFEFDALSEFNADVRYDADRIESDTVPLDDMTLSFSLKDGRLLVKPVVIGAAGGVVKANIRLVNKPGERPVRGEVELEVDSLRLGNITNKYGIADQSFGFISGQANFQTRGESVAKMLASIDGKASFMMSGGALDTLLVELGGFDGGEALLAWLGKDTAVKVRCAYIDASAQSGVLSLDTAIVDTTDTKFTMNGKVGFGKESLNLVLKAHPKDFSIFAFRTPLIIDGTFKTPNFHPSWGSLFARGAAAVALGAITPLAALLAMIEPGVGQSAFCPAEEK